MAYTVKQVAAMSGVSVRTLHFYHETGLLKPAHLGSNGYRFYEEPQLLALQQILFYRELGFELKQIKQILGRADFEKVAALQSHRKVLQKNLARTHKLIETIDKTILHLKGTKKMKSKEMFAGFSVAAGDDRFGEQTKLGDGPIDCKVSAQDTDGAMCVFESTGRSGWPRHLHYDQDEWIYVIDGEFDFQMGDSVETIDKTAIQGEQPQAGRLAPTPSIPPLPELQRRWKTWNETHKRFRVRPGESVFLPRKVAHVWASVSEQPGKIINVYQPAGQMEEFFREAPKWKGLPSREDVVNSTYTAEQIDSLRRLFSAHAMRVLGPPLIVGMNI
jgi:DNA-binding transcriptional MerR regulator/quercetin dioxygenase-like cupin family protein